MALERIKLAAAWLLLAAAATLLRLKTVLQSDVLILDSLFTDLFQHGGHWAEWGISQAPAFLPDMLLYLVAYPLLPDAASRIFFVSWAQVMLLGLAVSWSARQIYPQLSRQAQTTLLLLLALVTLVSAKSNMWLYFYSTNNHLGATIFGLVGLGLMLRQFHQPSRSRALLLVALLTVAQLSTKLFALSFAAPLMVLLVLALFALPHRQDWARPHRRTAWSLLGVLALAQVLATALTALLINNEPFEQLRPINPDTVARSFKMLLQSTAASFGSDNHWTQALAILLLLAALYLGLTLLRALTLHADALALRWPSAGAGPGWRYGAATATLLATLLVNVAGAVLSACFVDLNAYRYFTFPLTLIALMALILLDHQHQQRRAGWHAGAALLALIVLAGSVQTIHHHQPRSDPAKLVAACLDQIEAQGFPLQAGVGDYWNGSAVSYYLPHHNPILVTFNDATPMYWMSTLGPMLRPQDYPAHRHSNFVLLHEPGAGDQFDYSATTIGKRLPAPSRVQACPAAHLQIWLYDGTELDAAVAAIKANYLTARAQRHQ